MHTIVAYAYLALMVIWGILPTKISIYMGTKIGSESDQQAVILFSVYLPFSLMYWMLSY